MRTTTVTTLISLIILLLLPFATVCHAVALRNLSMEIQGTRALLHFDLSGDLGEREADVSVRLLYGGRWYDSGELKLQGELGNNIAIGPGKLIAWDVLHIFPGGFEEDVTWEVTANESNSYSDSTTGMKFKFVKGGCYDMGDTFGDSVKEGWKEERPVHNVCVDDFWMGKFEVTQGEYQKMMVSNPSYFKQCGADCPVEQVTWDMAQNFIKKLNLTTGKSYRLPTEAEWEYAARERGKKIRFGTGSDTISPTTANFDARAEYKQKYSETGEYRQKTVRVGSFAPNSLGLYDMAGNVWEWVQDFYDETWYKKGPKKGNWKNPLATKSGKDCEGCRVLRGGSWNLRPMNLRASDRGGNTPGFSGSGFGFRLVLSSQ